MPLKKLSSFESSSNNKKVIFHQFLSTKCKLDNFTINHINGDCSSRTYFRIDSPLGSNILMDSSLEIDSYHNFLKIGSWLYNNDFKSPKIYAHDEKLGLMLLEDFGHHSLASYIGANPDREISLYEKSIDILTKLHKIKPTIALKSFDHTMLNNSLKKFFLIHFLPNIIPQDNLKPAFEELLDIFNELYSSFSSLNEVVVLRDFHAENLMVIHEEDLGIIDFQDAMVGNPAYDLLSLLIDARRDVSHELKTHCIRYYIDSMGLNNTNDFNKCYAILSAQHGLRLIGLFFKLVHHDRKEQYRPCLIRTKNYLANTLINPELSPLTNWIKKHKLMEYDAF